MYKAVNKLSVDFDKTLFHTTNFPQLGKHRFLNRLVASYVRHKKKKGWIIILNTLREHDKGTLQMAINACEDHNIPFDYVNENYPPDVEYWGDCRKIGATLSIDDTNVGIIGLLLRKFG